MFKDSVIIALLAVSVSYLSGCAGHQYIWPTTEELQAVAPFKKKIAVLEISDQNSLIKGISAEATSTLGSMLLKQFHLIDRNTINQVITPKQFINYEDPASLAQIGKELGADFVLCGFSTASYSPFEIESTSSTNEEGEFYGSIYKERHLIGDVSVKIIDVSTGRVTFDGARTCNFSDKSDEVSFHDEKLFNVALKTAQTVDTIKDIRGHRQPQIVVQEYSPLVAENIGCAVGKFQQAFIRNFPTTGEIIEIVSKTKVKINLGSAYGIRLYEKFAVYPKQANTDPRTGLKIRETIPNVVLTVSDVTSGISCIATGRAKDIQRLSVGSTVVTVFE